jgi:excinuclease ABC subunit B
MQRTMDETNRRREKQIKYNAENNITPTTVVKSIEQVMAQGSVLDIKGYTLNNMNVRTTDEINILAEDENPLSEFKTIPQIEKAIKEKKKQMDKFAKAMDFMEAAKTRDEMFLLEAQLEKMKKSV